MADSLRDQLIAAGFEAPKKAVKKTAKNKRGKKDRPRTASHTKGKGAAAKPSAKKAQNSDAEAKTQATIEKRKKLKAQIKKLIDDNKLENWKGEIAYRYTVENRIRELYVNEAGQKKLTAREVAITRLNGDTYLVPISTASEITSINPQWSVFNTTEAEEATNTQNDEYAEFQVPDDLQW